MFKRFLLATVLATAAASAASAAPIVGSFSLGLSSGSYVGSGGSGTATAMTATGLDFGMSALQGGTGIGNGYGTNGSGVVYNTSGTFTGLNGTFASVADLALSGGTATPYTTNPFISLSGYNVNIASATYTATSTGIVVNGSATFTDGVAADATTGSFSLSTSSQDGQATSVQFTFTSNVSAVANSVPEPMSLALLGASLVGCGVVRAKRRTA